MQERKHQTDEINNYFYSFVLSRGNTDKLHFDNEKEASSNHIFANFSENWNNMMILVKSIEDSFNVTSIVTHQNYVRFEFENGENVQDKGIDKLEAFFSCCYQILTEYWSKGGPFYDRGAEPFDLDEI